MLAEAQAHIAPAEGNKTRADGVWRELKRIPIEDKQPVEILGPDDDPDNAVDHGDISDL
jgi:hypothetical protein